MKRFYSLLLALGMTSATMLAQTVTVFMKDNTVHKYNAEYLSKIAVRDATPSPDIVNFETIGLNVFSGGNVTVNMTSDTGDVTCEVDLYGSTDAVFLQSGVYVVEGTRLPFTVDPAYSKITMDGDQPSKPKSGTVAVSIGQAANPVLFREASDAHTYTIEVDLELENGKSLKGKYVGELPGYTPWLEAVLSGASYNVNPQPAGQFYIKFNDADWKYDIAMVFQADESVTTLPEGTYTYSETPVPGSILQTSYVDGYSPNFNCKLLPGSKVTVTKDGDNYNMVMSLNLNDGRTADFTFDGAISGTPSFETPEPIEMTPTSFDMKVWNSTNVTLKFYNESESQSLELDTYLKYGTTYLPEGVYIIDGGEAPYVATNISFTFFDNGTKTALKSGTLTVSRDGEVYTFVLAAELENGTPLSMTYSTTLPEFGPVINLTMSAADYLSNPQPKGSFYVKFHDADWNCEMAIHFWMFPFSNRLYGAADGEVFQFIDNTVGAPFTFTNDSYVNIYSPNSSNHMKTGSTISVLEETVGDQVIYTMQMDLLFEDGRTAHITYEGPISGTPTFQ